MPNWTVWLNRIAWNKNVFYYYKKCVFTFKLCAYAKLNSLKLNDFDIETVLTLNWIVIYRTVLTFYCVNKICSYAKLN